MTQDQAAWLKTLQLEGYNRVKTASEDLARFLAWLEANPDDPNYDIALNELTLAHNNIGSSISLIRAAQLAFKKLEAAQ